MWGLSGCWIWFWAPSSPSRAASSISQKIICSGDRGISNSPILVLRTEGTWLSRGQYADARIRAPNSSLKNYAGSVATRMPISSDWIDESWATSAVLLRQPCGLQSHSVWFPIRLSARQPRTFLSQSPQATESWAGPRNEATCGPCLILKEIRAGSGLRY